jgi:hypothetical protein
MRSIVGVAIAVAAGGILVFGLYSQSAPVAGEAVKAAPGVSFRILFGPNETQPAIWDGDIKLSDGEVAGIEGWLFAGDDAVKGKNGWKAASRYSAAGYRESLQQIAHGPLYPNGVLVTLSGVLQRA